jgi:hypothetical protein
MARVNIFLSDELLKKFNQEAKTEGVSRSELIQRAMEAYLEKAKQEREEMQKRVRMEEASRTMDQLAKKFGDWDPVPIVRFYRDTRYGSQWAKTGVNPQYRPKARRNIP